MASIFSMVLILFGVIALALGQAKNEVKKEESSLLSKLLQPGHEMKDIGVLSNQLEQEEVGNVEPETLTDEELADMLLNIEVPTRRVKRQIGRQSRLSFPFQPPTLFPYVHSVLNQGPGHDYSYLTSLRDRHGGQHSMMGHGYGGDAQRQQPPSYGLGYQYDTPDRASAFGAGVSNEGFRLGARHTWNSGRNDRFQHSLGGSYGYNRRTGSSAGLSYGFEFR